ncbi:MAG: Mut7-C RNAse domain-containing protein [Candidatus Rokuibacteriota bacterium]
MTETRFVADVMLGRLARWLRALGYDTDYFRDATDARLLGIALREGRQLLTRDTALAARAGTAGLLVRAEDLDEQIREVMTRYGLSSRAPLSRCLECNGALTRRRPTDVRDRVPPYTLATQSAFWECADCGRVFWAGTHARGILDRLQPYLDGADIHPQAGGATLDARPPTV